MSDPGAAAALAQRFHAAYERLAPRFGYETREASAKPWAEVPDNNRALMTAVCAELLGSVTSERHAGIERALRELVRLKDGPRDVAYVAAKEAAWQAARVVLADVSVDDHDTV